MSKLTRRIDAFAASSQKAFTLVELMVAVAIVGILGAIAYPSYIDHVIKSNRSAAESFMVALANKQEQYLLDNRQYTATSTDLMPTPDDVAKHYGITITTVAAPPSYTITATPIGSQLSRDTKCGTLTLTQTGTKGISGTGSVGYCW